MRIGLDSLSLRPRGAMLVRHSLILPISRCRRPVEQQQSEFQAKLNTVVAPKKSSKLRRRSCTFVESAIFSIS